MKITPLEIEGAWLAESNVFPDKRGAFREWFKFEEIQDTTGINFSVKQANISLSNEGVIRGIHYSLTEAGQAKWITCAAGHVLDVIVDIRPDSATYKKVVKVDLKGGEGRAILIGAGLGHGFLALENNSVVSYMLSSVYSPKDEFEINPLDKELDINWELNLVGGTGLIISDKDARAPMLSERFAENQLPRWQLTQNFSD